MSTPLIPQAFVYCPYCSNAQVKGHPSTCITLAVFGADETEVQLFLSEENQRAGSTVALGRTDRCFSVCYRESLREQPRTSTQSTDDISK